MLLNQQLWSVYQMASNRESIRALLLYDFEEEDTDLGYKFIDNLYRSCQFLYRLKLG